MLERGIHTRRSHHQVVTPMPLDPGLPDTIVPGRKRPPSSSSTRSFADRLRADGCAGDLAAAGFPPTTDPETGLKSTPAPAVLEETPWNSTLVPESTESWLGADAEDTRAVPSRDVDRSPRRIGKYEIVKDLTPGGQGSTWVVLDPDLMRHVVLKRYHRRLSVNQHTAVAREGQALARVRGAHLAQCHGMERLGDDWYLVLEYVPGRNLARARRDQQPDFVTAARWTAQVADGLSDIHACGLLHRDIKPENIILGDDGVVRLVDFGLATPFGSELLRDLSGTPCYMAPEQARGEWERIDPRSDIFGLARSCTNC